METANVIAHGRTAELLAYNEHQVLKLYRKEYPQHDADLEFALSKLIYEAGAPCPKPYKVIEFNERRGIVYERVQGMTTMKTLFQFPERLQLESERMAIAHYETHKRAVEGLPMQKEQLTYHITNTSLLDNRQKDIIIQYLDGLPSGSQLCHGDYHPDNVMGNIVIDWMNAVLGTPAGDVARSQLLLEYGALPDDMSHDHISYLEEGRKQILNYYLTAYKRLSGMKQEDIEAWKLPVAAARLDENVPEQEKEQLLHLIVRKLNELPEYSLE